VLWFGLIAAAAPLDVWCSFVHLALASAAQFSGYTRRLYCCVSFRRCCNHSPQPSMCLVCYECCHAMLSVCLVVPKSLVEFKSQVVSCAGMCSQLSCKECWLWHFLPGRCATACHDILFASVVLLRYRFQTPNPVVALCCYAMSPLYCHACHQLK
jgi:hypothetical protein